MTLEEGIELSVDERKLLERRTILKKEMLERSREDSLVQFNLNPGGQRQFVESVLKMNRLENWFLAANRSGKSDAGAYIGSKLARFGNPDAKWVSGEGSNTSVRDRSTSGWVVSLDFPSSRDIIQPKYFNNGFVPPGATHSPFIPARDIHEWRIADQILKLKNGSIIGFKSADSGRLKFQGTEKDWIHFDEEPPEGIYEESVIRVGQRALIIFGTCTLLPPEGQVGGATWIFNKKVKPWKQGQEPNIGIFTASIYENPTIPPEEIYRLQSIYPPGSIQRRIRLDGELVTGLSGSRIYSGFDYRLNMRELAEIIQRRPLAWIWDFNVEPMVSLVGQRYHNIFRIHKELILEEGNIGEMCSLFRAHVPYHMAEVWLFGDASGGYRSSQTKMSSYTMIFNEMKDYPAPIKLRVPEKNPSVIDRINAVNRACKTETGEICLEISPTCQELVDDLEQVVSDGRLGIKKTSNKKDPYFKRTHTSDALGYWISFEAPIRPVKRDYTRTGVRIKRPRYGKGRR